MLIWVPCDALLPIGLLHFRRRSLLVDVQQREVRLVELGRGVPLDPRPEIRPRRRTRRDFGALGDQGGRIVEGSLLVCSIVIQFMDMYKI